MSNQTQADSYTPTAHAAETLTDAAMRELREVIAGYVQRLAQAEQETVQARRIIRRLANAIEMGGEQSGLLVEVDEFLLRE